MVVLLETENFWVYIFTNVRLYYSVPIIIQLHVKMEFYSKYLITRDVTTGCSVAHQEYIVFNGTKTGISRCEPTIRYTLYEHMLRKTAILQLHVSVCSSGISQPVLKIQCQVMAEVTLILENIPGAVISQPHESHSLCMVTL